MGLEICCLGALRDDLLPGEWIEGLGDDAVWDAIMSIDVQRNPISLLAALDIALYRIGDERFREFAADAAGVLLDDNLGLGDDYDIYRLFHIICVFVTNAISFADGMSAEPGYWRRMNAWMQAGLILRTCVSATAPVDLNRLAEGFENNMSFGGDIRRIADCCGEPMVLASQLGAKSLRYEIAVRLISLKARHEGAGREVPKAQGIAAVLDRMSEEGATAIVPIPGPFELHRRPKEPVPRDFNDLVSDLWNSDNSQALELLAGASQLFVVDSEDVRKSVAAVQMLGNVNHFRFDDVLPPIYSASVIAAATRDHELADAIGNVVTRLAPDVSSDRDVQWMVRVLLQAAAAYLEESDWLSWLDERSSGLAANLPSAPKSCLSTFLWCVEGIEPVLPVGLWFHLRAKAIATAGAA